MNKILQFLNWMLLYLSPPRRGAEVGVGIRAVKNTSLATEHKTLHKQPSTINYLPKTSFFLLLFTLYCSLLTAQNFPVQVITQAIPPAPIYVSNYADASAVNGPLRVQIVLNDFEITNREIRIKTFFTGSGLSFQSNDIVVGADPLFLTGGTPLVLTNVELAPYFRFENLTGINGNQYGNPIPEGAYQFCVEVFDVLTGSRLSNRSCAVNVVFQNEPPFLVLPRNNTNVEEINPQYIVFQWTPRSINVTNVAYELSLVEIWDTQVDPQQAFLSSPPVFQTTTAATTYVYGPADPLLLSGKNYAWRVQAKAKQGTEEIGLFKNQGYSEIFSFSYAGSCDLPVGIAHEVKGSTNANISWEDFSTEIPEFTVRYRKKNGGEANAWFETKTTGNQLTIWDLQAGTSYEYQVSKKCAITNSEWSPTKEFTTFIADDEASVYDCGIQPDFTITNQEPLSALGDRFTAGDFPIRVLEASGSNGRFTGKGYVTIPYLNSIKVGVEFTNVLINTDNQLLEGSVITLYDPTLSNILDIDDAIDTVTDAVDAVRELAGAIGEALNLDISRDTKQKVNQIVDAIVTNIKNEDLPENLQNDIETAANQMKDAKERYDNAVANGDTSAAQIAQNDFNTAQNNLGEAQKEVAKYKDEVADLLKEAILELYREGRDMETTLITEYQTIIEERKNVLKDLGDIIFLDNEIVKENKISITLINKDQEELNTAESKMATYVFAQLLSQEDPDNQKLEFFLKELERMNITFAVDIENLKGENKNKQEIIEFLKVGLKRSFTLILLNGLPEF